MVDMPLNQSINHTKDQKKIAKTSFLLGTQPGIRVGATYVKDRIVCGTVYGYEL